MPEGQKVCLVIGAGDDTGGAIAREEVNAFTLADWGQSGHYYTQLLE